MSIRSLTFAVATVVALAVATQSPALSATEPAKILSSGQQTKVHRVVIPRLVVQRALIVAKRFPPRVSGNRFLLWSIGKSNKISPQDVGIVNSKREAAKVRAKLSRNNRRVRQVVIPEVVFKALVTHAAKDDDPETCDLMIIYEFDEDGDIDPHTIEVDCA